MVDGFDKNSVVGSLYIICTIFLFYFDIPAQKESLFLLVGLSIVLFVFKAVYRQGWKQQQPGITGVEGLNSQPFSWRCARNISKCWHEFRKWDNLLFLLGQIGRTTPIIIGSSFKGKTSHPLSSRLACLPNVISVLERECPLWSRI